MCICSGGSGMVETGRGIVRTEQKNISIQKIPV